MDLSYIQQQQPSSLFVDGSSPTPSSPPPPSSSSSSSSGIATPPLSSSYFASTTPHDQIQQQLQLQQLTYQIQNHLIHQQSGATTKWYLHVEKVISNDLFEENQYQSEYHKDKHDRLFVNYYNSWSPRSKNEDGTAINYVEATFSLHTVEDPSMCSENTRVLGYVVPLNYTLVYASNNKNSYRVENQVAKNDWLDIPAAEKKSKHKFSHAIDPITGQARYRFRILTVSKNVDNYNFAIWARPSENQFSAAIQGVYVKDTTTIGIHVRSKPCPAVMKRIRQYSNRQSNNNNNNNNIIRSIEGDIKRQQSSDVQFNVGAISRDVSLLIQNCRSTLELIKSISVSISPNPNNDKEHIYSCVGCSANFYDSKWTEEVEHGPNCIILQQVLQTCELPLDDLDNFCQQNPIQNNEIDDENQQQGQGQGQILLPVSMLHNHQTPTPHTQTSTRKKRRGVVKEESDFFFDDCSESNSIGHNTAIIAAVSNQPTSPSVCTSPNNGFYQQQHQQVQQQDPDQNNCPIDIPILESFKSQSSVQTLAIPSTSDGDITPTSPIRKRKISETGGNCGGNDVDDDGIIVKQEIFEEVNTIIPSIVNILDKDSSSIKSLSAKSFFKKKNSFGFKKNSPIIPSSPICL